VLIAVVDFRHRPPRTRNWAGMIVDQFDAMEAATRCIRTEPALRRHRRACTAEGNGAGGADPRGAGRSQQARQQRWDHFNILKALDWSSGAEPVSSYEFAGPRDPAVLRSLAVAHAQGIILVAAAGNAGPKSPPLYPAPIPT